MSASARARILVAGVCFAALPALLLHSAHAQTDSNWQNIVAAAKKEGKVSLYYQAVPAVMGRMIKDFETVYPEIKVEGIRQLAGIQSLAKIIEERQAGIDGADVSQYALSTWHRDEAAKGSFLKPVGPADANGPAAHLLYGTVTVYAAFPFVL